MSTVRIALANVEFPATPEDSIRLAEDAIAQASTAGADVICFPECFVPGYRCMGKQVAPPDAEFLERAWSLVAKAAAKGNITVVLGTERVVNDGLRISVLVINRDGTIAGFQDKVQLDPSEEEEIYSPGSTPVPHRGADLRNRHLSRRFPLSRNGALVRAARRAAGVPSSFRRNRTWPVPAFDLCRSGEYVSRKGGAVPSRGEHLLFRNRQLCKPRVAHDVRCRAA